MATTIQNLGYTKFVGQTNTTHGAQHGRGSSLSPRPTDQKIYEKHVPLTEGYDRGGAYWGIGSPLYLEFTADLTWWRFVRK
jgi:hypothetical protein